MPELPEVESIRRDLAGEVTGRTIASAEVLTRKQSHRVIRRYHGDRSRFESQLRAVGIEKVARKGKYLTLLLDNSSALIIHLGMSGRVMLASPEEPYPDHTHARFDFADGGQMRFVDQRTFGEMFVADVSELGEIPELARLGPDPVAGSVSREELAQRVEGRRARLKSLLMDQSFVAGIGNIYSDEILFDARLHPDRTADRLIPEEIDRLHEAIHRILNAAIEGRGTSMRDEQYRDLYGELGTFQTLLKVYQREGEPCVRCRTPIVRARRSNRSTHYCPVCQV